MFVFATSLKGLEISDTLVVRYSCDTLHSWLSVLTAAVERPELTTFYLLQEGLGRFQGCEGPHAISRAAVDALPFDHADLLGGGGQPAEPAGVPKSGVPRNDANPAMGQSLDAGLLGVTELSALGRSA